MEVKNKKLMEMILHTRMWGLLGTADFARSSIAGSLTVENLDAYEV